MPRKRRPAAAPDYLPKKSVRILENADPSDYRWVGDDGEYDGQPDEEALFGRNISLALVIKQIIAAVPSNRSDTDRLDRALEAILGLKSGRGRKKASGYDEVLTSTADEIFHQTFMSGLREPTKTVLRRKLQADPRFGQLDEDSFENRLTTAERRFREDRDRLLMEASLRFQPESSRQKALLEKAVSSLSNLGVPIKALPKDEIR